VADVADAVDLANAVDAADADAAGMLDAVGVCGLGHVGCAQTQTQRTWWAMDAVDLVDRGCGGAAQGSLGIWERSIGSF